MWQAIEVTKTQVAKVLRVAMSEPVLRSAWLNELGEGLPTSRLLARASMLP